MKSLTLLLLLLFGNSALAESCENYLGRKGRFINLGAEAKRFYIKWDNEELIHCPDLTLRKVKCGGRIYEPEEKCNLGKLATYDKSGNKWCLIADIRNWASSDECLQTAEDEFENRFRRTFNLKVDKAGIPIVIELRQATRYRVTKPNF